MLKQIRYYTVLLVCLMMSSAVFSAVEVKEFSSDELRERFQVLVHELRCPKCQNQNLADSDSPISADLREEIYRMLEGGSSDQEIEDFLVARYGDFVMYRPPVKKNTLMLWLAPGLLFVVGVFVVLMVRRRQVATGTYSVELEEKELEQLDQLLGTSSGSDKGKEIPEETHSSKTSGEH